MGIERKHDRVYTYHATDTGEPSCVLLAQCPLPPASQCAEAAIAWLHSVCEATDHEAMGCTQNLSGLGD